MVDHHTADSPLLDTQDEAIHDGRLVQWIHSATSSQVDSASGDYLSSLTTKTHWSFHNSSIFSLVQYSLHAVAVTWTSLASSSRKGYLKYIYTQINVQGGLNKNSNK
jgi:hypothetical protein